MPALPLDEAGKYVAAAYLVFVTLLLVYIVSWPPGWSAFSANSRRSPGSLTRRKGRASKAAPSRRPHTAAASPGALAIGSLACGP